VLDETVRQAVLTVMVDDERFGLADRWDDAEGRYVGLIVPPQRDRAIQVSDATLLVDWDVAVAQAEAGRAARQPLEGAGTQPDDTQPGDGERPTRPATTPGATTTPHVVPRADVVRDAVEQPITCFFGQVRLNPKRYGASFSKISKEVLERLEGAGADLEIVIDIQARKPDGFTESELRTIDENAKTLKFDDSGFATD